MFKYSNSGHFQSEGTFAKPSARSSKVAFSENGRIGPIFALPEAPELALTFYTDRWVDIPAPGRLKRGMRMVGVPALSEAKFRLYAALRTAGIRKVDLARRLQCSPSQVDRLLDITHHSKLDQIEAAFADIGKRLAIEILDAA